VVKIGGGGQIFEKIYEKLLKIIGIFENFLKIFQNL
jgi:hypothetical protein